MKTQSLLSYFGSESEVAPRLASFFNECKHVTIPFVGGGAIIPYLTARTIVANDLNELAINFYRVISGRYGEGEKQKLIEWCTNTLSHPDEIKQARMIADLGKDYYPPDRAWAYWVLCWLPRKGKGGTKTEGTGKPSVRFSPEGGNNASRIKSVAADLEAWAEHLKRCEFLCEDFRQVIPKVHDKPNCGIYVDAPWFGAGKAYKHGFTKQDHIDLRDMLEIDRFLYTQIVIRYDDRPFIRDLYRDFYIVDSFSRDQCNIVKGELCILNRVP